jgi:peptidylprolyl isomerase
MQRIFSLGICAFAAAAIVILAAACGGDDDSTTPVKASATAGSNPATSPTAGQSSNTSAAVVNQTVTTASGLKYADTVVGTGAAAKKCDMVTVTYVGTFTNGTKFDASADHGGSFSFVLGAGQVIKGWDEGVAGMKVGGKRTLYVPYALAYGAAAYGPIPAKSDLVFDVGLLKTATSSTNC